MTRLDKVLMVIVVVGFLGSGVLSVPAAGREAKLAIWPQRVPAEPDKYFLLPPEGSLVDGDAVPLYEKGLKALPGKEGDEQIRKWLDMPLDELPLEQMEQALERYTESLKCVFRASRCRQCNWPRRWEPGMPGANLAEFRRLAFPIRLWARLEAAGDGFDGALVALQTGFGMARHLGQALSAAHLLTGIGVGNVMGTEIEELVQKKGCPNLYSALAGLPRPFVDLEKVIEREAEIVASAGGQSVDSKTAYDRIRVLVQQFDSSLAALQCVEAIRSHVASPGNQLPGVLAEITEVSVPKDPAGGAAFKYTRTGTTAVLESAIPADGSEKHRVRYEIIVMK